MQNVQNAAEIQQRVMNLVDFYRNKVAGVGSDKYKAVCEYEKVEEQKQIEAQQKNGASSFSTSVIIPDELANQIKVNEQLLGYFYKLLEGENADTSVTNHLLANYYDDTILSTSDESFLVSHFKEMVNYIISTPCSHLSMKDWDEKDIWYIPEEVLNLACNRIRIPDNAIVYNPFVGFAQFATKLKNCSFICEDTFPAFNEQNKIEDRKSDIFAWTKLALVANKADTRNDEGTLPFDAVLSYIPYIPEVFSKEKDIALREKFESYTASIFLHAYKRMKEGGQMGIIIPNEFLWKCDKQYPMKELWEAVIHDNSLSEIIQLPSVMSYNTHHNYCLVVITRKPNSLTSMIDARFASKELTNDNVISWNDYTNFNSEEFLKFVEVGVSMRAIAAGEEVVLMAKNGKSNFIKALDINKLNAAEENGGKEAETGLRKIIKVEPSTLNVDLLVPQVYVVETPLSNEAPVPLSTLSTMVNTHVRDIKYNLPNETPWIREKNLSYTYQGELDLSHPDVDKAECPNIPPHTDDYVFDENGELDSELPWSQKTEIGNRVVDYRNCYYLDGKKDAVLFKFDTTGPKLAIIRAAQKPLAVDNRIYVFVPNADVDVFRLYVLLSMPLVYRQIQAIRDFGIYGNLHNVLIPMDQRIVGDEEKKALLEGETYKNHEEKLQSIKTEYINEVRMRKHDMGQYIFELVNIEDLMRYYIENRETEQDFCSQIEGLLDNFRSSLGELSVLLENLSKEEEFGKSEAVNLDDMLSHLNNRHKADGFKISYQIDESSVKKYNRQKYNDAMIAAAIEDHEADMALEDAMIAAAIEDHEANMALEDAMIAAAIEDHEADMALEDAMIAAAIEDHEADMALEDAMMKAAIEDHEADMALEDAMIEAAIEDHEADMALEDAMIEDATEEHEKDIIVENVIGRNKEIPSLYVSKIDLQRLISNIVDNARKHGFTDSNRKDYEMKVSLSIDSESNSFQIDFKNNGNPLPEGMNKMRYGIKGEKAGKTAGTGIGGSYVKKFVEHYGGDYDVFMEGDWTVIRIVLPIKK